MGLFDTVVVECDLPKDAPKWLKDSPVFQTYDLGRMMGDYAITQDRELVVRGSCIDQIVRDMLQVPESCITSVPIKYKRKKIELFTSNLRGLKGGVPYTDGGHDAVDITYRIWIYDGKVGPIKQIHCNVRKACPFADF